MKTATKRRTNARRATSPIKNNSREKKHERKRRVLKQGALALVRSIASAIIIKNQDIFFVTEPDGSVPLDNHHGFGLYFHDCRFLNGYELKIAGSDPVVLASTADRGFMSVFDLTNPDIQLAGGKLTAKEQIGITWRRTLDNTQRMLSDRITFQNFTLGDVEFPISLSFQSAFEDIFEVRGAAPERCGKHHPPAWKDGILYFLYDGADGRFRSLSVHFSPVPKRREGTTSLVNIRLGPRESKEISVVLIIAESHDHEAVLPEKEFQPNLNRVGQALQRSGDEWVARQTSLVSDNIVLNAVLDRSLHDLESLRSRIERQEFFAAGLPWFGTLFGRDSLITALQTLAYNPLLAEQTLRVLARYQGKRVNEWRDEEPGKILHELRIGEMARLNEIPQTPYYGSIDSTPLFLILVAQHAAWTGSLSLFNDLKKNIQAALKWIADHGDRDGDGYIEYQSKSEKGLSNQGWKDSGDAIMNADGTLARPPIALVEVQGYVYFAKLGIADLFERAGDAERAQALRQEAAQLRQQFNRDFWMQDAQFFALALQAKGKLADVISSNPGQALWTGIIDEGKAHAVVGHLMDEDMFSEWGVRTLSRNERRYNPIGYHLGTVWPHDNSIIAAGLRRYGYDDEFCRVFVGMLEAAMGFSLYRLPELFAGFSRRDYGVPVHYPVACHPQAWAAGTFPSLVTSLLGLVPEAFEKRLRIVRPILPEMIDRFDVKGLHVGQAKVDLSFERTPEGAIAVKTERIDGELRVQVEPAANPEFKPTDIRPLLAIQQKGKT